MSGVISSAVIGFMGAEEQASATESAAAASAAAQRYATDIQKQMFEKQIELQEPWRQAGINALAKMQAQYNQMPAAFTGQVNLGQDPGYAFRLSEGQKALERSAAARGGLLSGGTLKGTQRFAQDLASQEYQNAYNRALTQYNAAAQREATGYNRLAALAGVGQTATGALSSAAGQTGSNLGNLYYNAGQSAGQSRASGYMGVGNAATGGLNSYLNYSQNQNLMNKLFPSSGNTNWAANTTTYGPSSTWAYDPFAT